MLHKSQQGFTLIELMIVIAIIGILASVAVPQYGAYIKRAKFSEVVSHAARAKTAVSLCYYQNNDFNTCNGAGNGRDNTVPANITTRTGRLESMTILLGIISAQGHATELDGATYKLTPDITDGRLSWDVSGTCVTSGYCKGN